MGNMCVEISGYLILYDDNVEICSQKYRLNRDSKKKKEKKAEPFWGADECQSNF